MSYTTSSAKHVQSESNPIFAYTRINDLLKPRILEISGMDKTTRRLSSQVHEAQAMLLLEHDYGCSTYFKHTNYSIYIQHISLLFIKKTVISISFLLCDLSSLYDISHLMSHVFPT